MTTAPYVTNMKIGISENNTHDKQLPDGCIVPHNNQRSVRWNKIIGKANVMKNIYELFIKHIEPLSLLDHQLNLVEKYHYPLFEDLKQIFSNRPNNRYKANSIKPTPWYSSTCRNVKKQLIDAVKSKERGFIGDLRHLYKKNTG